jgi:hypothetical protein
VRLEGLGELKECQQLDNPDIDDKLCTSRPKLHQQQINVIAKGVKQNCRKHI